MNADKSGCNDLSEVIIGRAFVVSNTLGVGFLEKVYENALAHELRKAGFSVCQQYNVRVSYDGVIVGVYTADLLVEDAVLVELKVHSAQCLNCLKATGLPLCLLLNFGNPRLEIRRFANGL